MKWLKPLFWGACSLIGAWLVLRAAPFLHPRTALKAHQERELRTLGARSIESLDVPVGALLLYGDSIIGRGYNTVRRDGNAGGHAEINAISDALKRMGTDGFRALDNERLTLVSTFEPCAMCKGAALEYRVHHIRYVEPKSLTHWLKEDLNGAGYEMERTRTGNATLQDSLFRLHPLYDPEKDQH